MGMQAAVMYKTIICFLLLNQTFGVIDTPPRGWNSYDSYLDCVNETQVIENANAMVKYLKPFGYEYVVIDSGWWQPSNITDKYGRLQPDITKYPHSANGTGFKWLSDEIHSMGLKFGIWVGRGINQYAIDQNTAIYGTDNKIHAKDVVDYHLQCPWRKTRYGLNMSLNGSQQWYNSLYSLYSSWNVDFIKYDCVFAGNFVYDQITGAYNGIMHSNHSFVLSLSPGNGYANISSTNQITSMVNMYRITGDTWDMWDPSQTPYGSSIISHFNITAIFAANNEIGKENGLNGGKSFPDLDMLPLGYMTTPWVEKETCEPHKYTSLKYNQQRVLFTLWCIARSPLIFGGVVSKLENDSFTLNLLTNKYALNVNFNSTNNRQVVAIYGTNGLPQQIVWVANGMLNDFYVAFFNIDSNNLNNSVNMQISFEAIGINNTYKQCNYVQAWTNQSGVASQQTLQSMVKPNDTALIYLHSCR